MFLTAAPRRPHGPHQSRRPGGRVRSVSHEVIRGVVEAQGTIAAAVEEQDASTAQTREAISGASREAARMAAELRRIAAAG